MMFANGSQIVSVEVFKGNDDDKGLYSVYIKTVTNGKNYTTQHVFHVDEFNSVFELIWQRLGYTLLDKIKDDINKGDMK